jgi:hypothetical protein
MVFQVAYKIKDLMVILKEIFLGESCLSSFSALHLKLKTIIVISVYVRVVLAGIDLQ